MQNCSHALGEKEYHHLDLRPLVQKEKLVFKLILLYNYKGEKYQNMLNYPLFVGNDGQPDPSTFIECVVNFQAAE